MTTLAEQVWRRRVANGTAFLEGQAYRGATLQELVVGARDLMLNAIFTPSRLYQQLLHQQLSTCRLTKPADAT